MYMYVIQVNAEGIVWQRLCNPYTVLLNKCANHLGLLLPGTTASKDQEDKVQYYAQILNPKQQN